MNHDNIKTTPLKPSEAVNPLFFNKNNLQRHARKHVLNQKEEKWEKILGNDLVRSLRRNDDTRQMKDLTQAYEWYIAESATSNCLDGIRHIHTGRRTFKEDMSALFYSREEIHGCTNENIFYILSKSVRNQKTDLYNIVTAYKPYPKAKNGAKKLIHKDICNEMAKSSIQELADHWDKKDLS